MGIFSGVSCSIQEITRLLFRTVVLMEGEKSIVNCVPVNWHANKQPLKGSVHILLLPVAVRDCSECNIKNYRKRWEVK